MLFNELMAIISGHPIRLQHEEGDLVILGDDEGFDDALMDSMRLHKHALIDLVKRNGGDWLSPAFRITPDMLPLAGLSQEAIDRIVETVQGGAANVQDIYPLAPLQEGILYHHISATQGDPYVLHTLFGAESLQRLEHFAQALQGVMDRHDILRTAIVWEGLDEPMQVVWQEARLGFDEVVLDPADGDIARQLQERFDTRHYRMDVRQAPLMRLVWAADPLNSRWVAMLLFHHMALDHAALELVQHETQAFLLGVEDSLPEAVSYRNYVAQARQGAGREAHEAFFRDMLADVEEPTLPFGFTDALNPDVVIEEARLPVDEALGATLRGHARRLGVSAASLVHLAWAQVLGRISGREDVVFGTVLMGRMQGGEGADRALGLFINTLPLRVELGTQSVDASIKATHQRLTGLLGHEHASLALAQRCSGVAAPTPLFGSLLNYRHGSAAQAVTTQAREAWHGLQILGGEERSNYPITVSVDDLGDRFVISVLALAQIGAQRIGDYLSSAFEQLAQALEQDPRRALSTLDLLPAAERNQLLTAFNDTTRAYPRDSSVTALFEAHASLHPEAPAAVHGEQQLGYGQLNERANVLAEYLRAAGIQPGDRVAMELERSFELLISQLAILKCGAVYVPLDVNAPAERLQFILEDSQARVLLSVSSRAPLAGIPRLDLDTLNLDAEAEPVPQQALVGGAPAYVMYTSGSTGTPKGVLVTHRAISRLVIDNGYADFNAADRVAFASNPAFDASTLEVWAALLNGGCVVLVDQDVLLSRAHFAGLLLEQSVSVLWMTAGLFHQYASGLSDAFARLRYLIVGGDVLDPVVIARVLANGAPRHLLNGYGPTEATTFSTTWEIERVDGPSIPIGRPIGNSRVYVLDAYMRPAPLGVTGELYIGGDGVARGYLNRPDLTLEKFIPDPFGTDTDARLYRTGDLGCWRPDGSIEYRGRNDDQVKIRGFRIELGEISARLSTCAGVADATVLVRAEQDTPGQKRLVAYVIAQAGVELSAQALRDELLGSLAEYMVPAAFVMLDAFPLTANGKLDRRALPEPGAEAFASREYEAPQGPVEETLATLWAQLLKVERVGRFDHFFELGGHSLLAVSLIERMRQVGLRADVRVLFSQPTLAALAAAVGESHEISVPANVIGIDSQRITPAMLPLADLDQTSIDRIVGSVPGGLANIQDIYALAPLQEGILYHHLAAEQGDPYVLQTLFGMADRGRLSDFVQALQAVVDRHDILRTAVFWEGLDSPVQVVCRQAQLSVEEVSLDPTQGDIAEQLQARFDPRHFRLDLAQPPLLCILFAEDTANQRCVALLLFHHLALDHTALEVVQHEMQAWLLGRQQELGEAIAYRNYVAQARLGVSREAHESFFRGMLGEVDEPTLPFGLQNVQGDGGGVEEAKQALAEGLDQRLRAQARHLGVSLASLVHLAWGVVLGAIAGKQDVVFGTVLMGRMQGGEGTDRAIGLFINTLPLRLAVGEQGVRGGVRAAHERLTDLLGHEHASLALAQRCSGVPASMPLFSALLNYRHSAAGTITPEALQAWKGIEGLSGEERTNYPLTLNVDDLGDNLLLTALAQEGVDARRVCGYMQAALLQLVEALELTPQAPLRSLSVLPETEREQLLQGFNDTSAEYPLDQTVHGLFEAQVERTPDAVAVVYGHEHLIYAELNQRANRLAHHLRSQGVVPDSRVAICVERGIDMVVGLLAILKAGGGYVPLDPAYPVERLAYMLQDSAPAAVLAQTATLGLLSAADVAVVNLDEITWQDRSVSNPVIESLTPAHLAYVIYTSGSTGLPKGVMIEHRNTVNFLTWAQQAFEPEVLAKTLFSTSLNFDLAVYECFAPLASGGSIEVVKNVLALQEGEHDITLINTVPSALKALLESGGLQEGVHTVNVAGEALKGSLVERLFAETGVKRLCNLYGPSETTTYSSWVAMDREDGFAAHIGKPVANTQFYLLDEHRQPVPLGVPGEIYIGGAGVARGYLNRDDLTAERFLEDPFNVGARMYRTGDLGRWLQDGNIEYLGRNDDQVKIRGFRIELGEIEAKLARHERVKETVVMAREDVPGDKRLVAYFTSTIAEVDLETLRTHLQSQLPEYMVPAAYVHLEKLPLTPNGKLDRKALPAPDQQALISRGYEAPQGETEITLAQIWADVLKVERVGRHDHFFELGGHSLLAVTLIERMRRKGLSADVRILFSQPTVAALAAAVGHNREVVVPANLIGPGCTRITPELLPLVNLDQPALDRIVASVPGGAANVQDIYPLAPLQAGILYHHVSAAQGDPYVLQATFTVRDQARIESFATALQKVIDRHDTLRTSVFWKGLESPVQVVWRQAQLVVDTLELNPVDGDVAIQIRERFSTHHHRLDLGLAPLMRLACAFDQNNGRWVMLLMFHHMALDHTALEVVRHEMQAFMLGEGDSLPAAMPYRNYVAQACLGLSEQDHETFFRSQLGDIEESTLAFGQAGVRGDGSGIEEARIALDDELSLRVRAQARKLGSSAASVLHLAWALVARAACGRDQVVFGTVLMGRMQGGEGSDRALGMFINTLPLRVDIDARSVVEGVKSTHARLTALLGHEHASLALAQRCSAVAAPAPLFNTLLNYRHSSADVTSDQALSAWDGIESLSNEERTNYPLTLSVDDLGTGFAITALAMTEIGAQRVCDTLACAVTNLIDALEHQPDTALHAIAVLPQAEREQLLHGFNDSAADYPRDSSVQALFERQVAARPEAVAAVHGEQALTYAELNAQANRLAHHLIGQGVIAGDAVAILLPRSLDLLVAQLAIIKCAAIYVPLDINAPQERQAFMVQDSGARHVLTHSNLVIPQGVARIDLDSLDLTHEHGNNPELACSSESAAYIMYTSGSTGTPKGVLVPHRAIARLVFNNGYADFNVQDRVAFASNPAFDASTLDVWAPLLNGGSVVVVDQDVLLSLPEFRALLLEQSVSVLWMTAGLFHQYASCLYDAFAQLRYLIVGGDVLDPSIIAQVLKHGAPQHLLNGYGPTEATTFSATHEIKAVGEGSIPIGKPLANTRLYVLDARQQPVPLGVTGELYIGGDGVALGYLNRAELTEQVFVADPFSNDPAARLYRTGDLACWLPDGSVEYRGRNDNQVKIRGFRIEIGEIEARLAQCVGVKESVVLARQDADGDEARGPKQLVGYVTALPGASLSVQELRRELSASLADYMVPVAFVVLDSLPLTANGKLDRRALPAPDAQAYAGREYEAPVGHVESVLADLWADVLKVERVGRHDHFFELGGHSLLAVKLIEKMRQQGLSADVRVLFSQPTLMALAAAVGNSTEIRVPANLIEPGCTHITLDMLPLLDISEASLERVLAAVPGGAANVQDIYPLAPLQEGILYHYLTAEAGDPYVLQSQYAFDSRERLDAFIGALQSVINRHDILRTAVHWTGLDEPVQVVCRNVVLQPQFVELDPANGPVATQLSAQFDARHYRLDLTRAPLLHLACAEDKEQNRWVATLLFHHLALDHTALEVMQHEMQAFLLGTADQLGAAMPYRNYVAQARLGVEPAAHEAFFREMLGDISEPTLPFGVHDVQGDGQGIEEARAPLDIQVCNRLRQQARQLGVSAASLVHLAWALVLGKVSATDDVVFGTVLLGRMQGGEGADRALGMFINTLPLRVSLDRNSVRQAVSEAHGRLTGLLVHEHASLALAQRCSGVAATTPLFSALLNYRHSNAVVTQESLNAWEGMQTLGGDERTNYPLTLNVDDLGEGFHFTVLALESIGARRVCDYVQVALEQLTDALEQAPQTPLNTLSILPRSEREQLLHEWNASDSTFADDLLIHRAFEVWAAKQPSAAAIRFEGRQLSYGELNARANQVAHRLMEQGIGPDDRVAICAERGLEMIIGLLGILKAGAGYVPLDPAYPAERLAYLLKDSEPLAVLVQKTTANVLSGVSVPVINLDDARLQEQSVSNPQVSGQTSSHLAYVIYTSGSTGLPKGVQVEHRNVARLFSATQAWFEFGPTDTWALFHSFAFDFSVWEIWGALIHGGELLIVPQLVSRSPQECYALICEAGVTVLNQTPSAFRQLIAAQGESHQAHSLRQVIFGGEALETGILKPWYARPVNAGTQLVNMYGITETTVHVTYRALQAADALKAGVSPIGVRIPDLQTYVLDANREPVPVGVVGELYVGGAGVARGYLNRPELNEERFIADPFSQRPGARLYRTGDLARWTAEGSLDYLGRNDDQVKIRGFRIELGEVEAQLAASTGVREAVVIAREDIPGDKRLVAYVIAEEGAAPSAAELRDQLLQTLAEHMLPSAFVTLESLPLTTNGKLDRKALPAPDQSALASRAYEAPQGEVEVIIAQLWQELLDVEQVGRHDHFFELGGHSLLAVKLIERMRQQDLSADVRVLFGQPTLAALAAAVGGQTEILVPANLITEGCERITPDMLPLADLDQDAIDRVVASVPGGIANIQDIYALAPLQEGILYHHLAAAEGDPYLQYALFSFDGLQRLQQFAAALQAVVSRHDILRTGVLWERLDEPVQVVWRHAELAVEEVRLDPAAGDIADQLREALDPRHYRLDIRQAPMMRIGYAHDPANNRWLGMLLFHHMVDDATSLGILTSEIEAFMCDLGDQLPASVPYRNYVAQARLGVSREAHEAFFREMLGDIDEPTLPFGLHDVQGDGQGIQEVRQVVDASLGQRLRVQARKLGVGAASLYHLGWARVLGALSGRDEVVFGTVLLGRMQGGAGADRALGMFINTLPLRVDLGDQHVSNGVRKTHANLTALLGHEHASLVLAQRCSGVEAPTPLFSSLLNYRHLENHTGDSSAAAWEGIQALSGEERTNYPLTLSVDDLGEGFNLTVMAEAQIGAERVCGYMQRVMHQLIDALEQAPQTSLNSLSILPRSEREQLLYGWNANDSTFADDLLIHRAFEEWAAKQPSATAIRFEGRQLSYGELNTRANQVAHHLMEQGIAPDDRVAICVERGLEMIIGLLGILKAGAGYVPLDPAYPAERLAYLLKDSEPLAVLVQQATADVLSGVSVPVINLDDARLQEQSVSNPQVDSLTASHLAYVIYTSGSTGLPKGVQIEHRNVARLFTATQAWFDFGPTDTWALFHSFAFDFSVWEIWGALLHGGELLIVPQLVSRSPQECYALICEAGVTVLNQTPSAFRQLIAAQGESHQAHSLRQVIFGGEALETGILKPWYARPVNAGTQLVNMYGITETTVHVTYRALQAADALQAGVSPIGVRIPDLQTYVLDAKREPVPVGVVGELYVGGAGVARGYLNRPELNEERFIADPFSSTKNARLYRTGDLARWTAEGSLDYLGRNDDQVKIRGF
ncbi:amino acid adenylation domain-containing protein, partial [Pseudomonas sp. KFB-139]